MKNIAILFAAFVFAIACKPQKAHDEHDAHGNKTYYTCSMDPQVIETKPGKCPICHMDLTPISLDQVQSNGLKLSDDQLRLANIKLQKVKYDFVGSKVFATGTVKENQNNIRYVNARIDGRIERLSIKTNGTRVKKGQILYQVYSEMLAATQSEFIQNWKALSQNPNDALLKSIQQTASIKLLLWGLTEMQIEQLKLLDKPHIPYPILSPLSGVVKNIMVVEGSTVMEGDPLIELTEYKSLWVEAQFYPNETTEIKNGSKVSVYVEESNEAIEGTVVQVLPQVSPSSTVNIVRILISPKDQDVRPGMQANIAWHKAGNKSLVIPSKAVLREAKGNTVWTKNKDDVYEPKMVHLGEVSGDNAEILHGLKEGDEVVISGAYLLQSEYVFKKGANPMAGHDMGKM